MQAVKAKKQAKKRPTLKQKKAAQLLSENPGMPLGQAMREAGYSERTSLTPQNLTASLGWTTIADALPDNLLAKVHLEGLNATDSKTGERDYAVRHKYLDSAYKLKGSYAPEKHTNTNLNVNVDTAAQSQEILTMAEAALIAKMRGDDNSPRSGEDEHPVLPVQS